MLNTFINAVVLIDYETHMATNLLTETLTLRD